MIEQNFELLGEVVVDGRKRMSLARLVKDLLPGDRFRVELGDWGEIRMVPVVSIERSEMGDRRHG